MAAAATRLALIVAATCLQLQVPLAGAIPDGYTLEQLHVVFRHGNRTPERWYPTDPNIDYPWYPMGWDQLTEAGVDSTYRLGLVFREHYNGFLGDVYTYQDVNATSTDSPRAKQCLQAFMAGAYPPRGVQQWGRSGLGLMWQPIVYFYTPKLEDDFLYMKMDCPQYDKEYAEVRRGAWTKEILARDPGMLRDLKEKAGIDSRELSEVSFFYCTISIETYHNLTIPSWVKPYYPTRLENIALYHFHQHALTRSMQRFKAGPLVKHMLGTIQKASDQAAQAARPAQPRVWIYSGHDDTVSALALAIKSWGAIYPDFNAMITLELLRKQSTGEYAVEILLRESHAARLRVVTVEGCESPCPLEKFQSIVKDVIPQDWRKECQGESSSSSRAVIPISVLILITMARVFITTS